MTELRSERFEWFGPSPIEPFNLAGNRVAAASGSPRGTSKAAGAASGSVDGEKKRADTAKAKRWDLKNRFIPSAHVSLAH